jgi:hypothetical protein
MCYHKRKDMIFDSTQSTATMAGHMTQASGRSIPVFLRFRSGNQEKERVALQMVQHSGSFPAPRFLGSIQVEQGTLLIQS